MRSKALAIAKSLGALLVTLALVVGIPAFLIFTVGNPFPSSMPSIDEIRILLTQNGQGFTNFLIGTLAVIIWFIWAQLMVALIVEIVATIRRVETRSLPTLPGIQSFAARLIAGITLATTLAVGPILAPIVGSLTFDPIEPAAASVMIDEPASVLIRSASTTTKSESKTDAGRIFAEQASTVLIVDGPTELWDLAEAAYGDGISWNLIAEANAGRVDSAGSVMTIDTEVVPPGTSLRLPGQPLLGQLASFGELPTDVDGVRIVEAGDSMWSLAETEVEERIGRDATDGEVAEYWVDVVATNQDTIASGDADLIYPGEELVLPGAGPDDEAIDIAATAQDTAQADSETPAVAAPGAKQMPPRSDAFDGEARDPSSSFDAHREGDAAGLVPAPVADRAVQPVGAKQQVPLRAVAMAAFGSTLLAAGVVGALRRRRELMRRQRPVGAIARQPSSEAAAFETALVHSSHEVRESQQGQGWRVLPADAVAAVRAGGPMQVHAEVSGRLHAVSLSDGVQPRPEPRPQVELHSELTPQAVAQAFDVAVEDLQGPVAEPGTSVVPTTLIVGTDEVTGDAVFIDLESAGLVEIAGEASGIARFARSAILDLAVSDRADDLCIIAVGIGHELVDLERVRAARSYAEALAQAVRCGHAADDSLTPVVIIGAQAPDADDQSVAALVDLGAVVLAPGLAAPVRITVTGDRAELWPAGTSVILAALTNEDFGCMAELVEITDPDACEVAEEPIVVSEHIDVPVITGCVVEPGPVEVKVLGPVEVAGASKFSSIKAVDVVCYLAFHRHGVDGDQIKTWVWPSFEPPTDKAFANVLSRARTGLGVSEDGSPFLSRAGADKTYRLADDVTTDFDRFRAMVELADQAPNQPQRLEHLKQALELIRGVPFAGGTASSFAWADNHVRAHVEFTIDEAVHRCADLALELDDLATARWAALKGLELVPGCEQCFKRRFLVARAGNNRTELRRAMADLERTAAAELGEPEAVDSISGDLLDLYHELDRALVAGPV